MLHPFPEHPLKAEDQAIVPEDQFCYRRHTSSTSNRGISHLMRRSQATQRTVETLTVVTTHIIGLRHGRYIKLSGLVPQEIDI